MEVYKNFKISVAFVKSQTPGFSSIINFLTTLSSIIIEYRLDLLPIPKPEQSNTIPRDLVTSQLPSAIKRKSLSKTLLKSCQAFITNWSFTERQIILSIPLSFNSVNLLTYEGRWSLLHVG